MSLSLMKRIPWPKKLLVFLSLIPGAAFGWIVNPDFTAPGVIAALKADPKYSSLPYNYDYNLGATGLRGWVYLNAETEQARYYGLLTDTSRQILVTVVDAPGNAVLMVNDVILGATAESTGAVPLFTSDSRKTMAAAIGAAEIGISATQPRQLRVKRWREGVGITDVSFPMASVAYDNQPIPIAQAKSIKFLAAARTRLVSELLANPNFLSADYIGATNGLALLAGVVPGDANYAEVQSRLKTFAIQLAADSLPQLSRHWWRRSYMNMFLGEYYLRCLEDSIIPDPSILPAIARYTLKIAQGQGRYGAYGHEDNADNADGSFHGPCPPYGPVNAVSIPTNISIVIAKKALLAGGQTLNPEIDQAIQRASNFYAFYCNKGSIPYGENEPWVMGHSSNGKDAMCAVFFGLQSDRATETEYFTRMSVAGHQGREFGHSGQEWSYFWGALGANVGGPLALTQFMEKCNWHFDLARRTNSTFIYDGATEYGAGGVSNNTYLGPSLHRDGNNLNSTASYLLTYSLPLKRLLITGRNANPAHILSAAKVTQAIAAATYRLDCRAYSNDRLLTDISNFDPIVRSEAAQQLGGRALSPAQITTLTTMATDITSANSRMGACETLGIKNPDGLSSFLKDRLQDPDIWVRAKATRAIQNYSSDIIKDHRDSMLATFVAHAADPNIIPTDDPIQIANRYLSVVLFGNSTGDGAPGSDIRTYTKDAPKPLLYQALRAALKQPSSYPRFGVATFIEEHLTLTDVQALTLDMFNMVRSKSQADPMWYIKCQLVGLRILQKYSCAEVIPLALSLLEARIGWTWDSTESMPPAMATLVDQGDLARWALPTLKKDLIDFATMDSSDSNALRGPMQATIDSVTNAIAPKTGLVNFLPMATPQVVTTTAAKAITLTGTTPRGALTYAIVTQPSHGTLTGTAPNVTYTPTAGYRGVDQFTFKATDSLTASEPGTVSLIVGTSGTGLLGRYFDNMDFTNLKLTRVDPQVNFDWADTSPATSVGADTFSVRWTGQLLIPETGNYTFSTLNSDGVRLSVNGVRVIDDLVDRNTSWNDSATINLTAGQRVDIEMHYYDNTGLAVAKLKWTGPSFAGLNGTLISREWLYDGPEIPNTIPLGDAQSFNVFKNGIQPITLTGRGAGLTPLSYVIVTQPSHGTLTGTAPNLTYRPTTNYSGTDRFTFYVNNGLNNSAPATITLNVSTVQLTNYFWSQPVAGDWSGSLWKDAAGGALTLASGGNLLYSLSFDKPGIYTTTHNLNPNFIFNQLHIASGVTIAGSSSLAPSVSESILPQINQNSSSSFTVNTPINLGATTTLGGTGQGPANFAGPITGTGGLTLQSDASWRLFGLPTQAPNTYQGGTVVHRGVLQLGAMVNGASPLCANPAGSGPITLNDGATLAFERVTLSNEMTLNGGTLITPNGWGASLSGPITLNGTVTCNASVGTLFYSGNLTGRGGFTKLGTSNLRFSGTNDSTGRNSVTQGVLQCNSSAALGRGDLDISDGAKVELAYLGTRSIAGLSYNGGLALPPGTYGSATSSAANVSAYFTGTGTITISPSSSTVLARTLGSSPSAAGSPVTFTATVVGVAPTGVVHFMHGTTLLGTASLNNLARASVTLSSLTVGGHRVTAEYMGDNNNSASDSPAVYQTITSSPFQTWASSVSQGLTAGVNSSAEQDPDHDGMCNLIEFALGSDPMGSAPAAAPALTKTASTLQFTYSRSDASLAPGITQAVEYGSDLIGWVSIPITTDTGGAVTVIPGAPSDRVSVSIPNAGPRVFVRLRVTQ